MSADNDVTRAFLEFSRHQLCDEYWPRLRHCVESLTDEQTWWRPNGSSNSVGNILLHLNGNVTQWLIVPFGSGDDHRDRPAEFAQRAHIPRTALLHTLESTLAAASSALGRVTTADLLSTLNIQGYTTTGLSAIYHVVEHFGMHYGQVVYVTKQLRDCDLGFYRDLNETGRRPDRNRS